MKRGSGDDDLEVELVDAPDLGVRTVELRPPRRRKELLLVVAAVAVVAGVGLIGDGGDGDAQATPTTTSTRRDDERTSTTRRRSPRSTTIPRPTTTTSWPQFEAGTGTLLPGELTGAKVGLVTSTGQIVVVDLDTGERCRTAEYRNGLWVPWSFPTPGRMYAQTGAELIAVDDRCATTVLPVNANESWAAAATDRSVWLMVGSSEQRLIEIALDTGERTGRDVAVPRYQGATVVGLGDDLVLEVSGQMTLVDPDTDERTDLGVGTPLAATDSRLAYVTCPELRCHLAVLDVTTGEHRVTPDIEPVTWEPAQFSSDGRHLRVAVPTDQQDQPTTAIVDVETGELRALGTALYSSSFTPDGQWLVGLENGRAIAVKVDGTVPNIEIAPDISSVQNLALL